MLKRGRKSKFYQVVINNEDKGVQNTSRFLELIRTTLRDQEATIQFKKL